MAIGQAWRCADKLLDEFHGIHSIRVEIACRNEILIVSILDSARSSCPSSSKVPFQHVPLPSDPNIKKTLRKITHANQFCESIFEISVFNGRAYNNVLIPCLAQDDR